MQRTLHLRDGRRLAWASLGDPDGSPIVALHGSPDSSTIWRLADPAARRIGAHLVAPDRPGFGGSDPHPGATVLDWVDDQDQLLDHLGIERAALLAVSGGSPAATAVAWARPEQVTHLGLWSVIAPLHEPGVLDGASTAAQANFRLARRAPVLLRLTAGLMVTLARRRPDMVARLLVRSRPPADRVVIARPDVTDVLHANIPRMFHDTASIVREMTLAARDWGFPLEEIAVPTTIWVGGRDDVHPPSMARHLAARIPDATLHLEPTYGTFDWLDRMDELLTTVLGTGPDR